MNLEMLCKLNILGLEPMPGGIARTRLIGDGEGIGGLLGLILPRRNLAIHSIHIRPHAIHVLVSFAPMSDA